MCEKKIDCWQPADLSKTAGNWQRKAKIPSLRSVKRILYNAYRYYTGTLESAWEVAPAF